MLKCITTFLTLLIIFVIVKALLRVCMKNTAQGECRVVIQHEMNAARDEVECCIYETPPSVVFSYTQA